MSVIQGGIPCIIFVLYVYREEYLAPVQAQVMTRDDSSGGWVPMGTGGLSNVGLRRLTKSNGDPDVTCRHDYFIYGQRIADSSVRVWFVIIKICMNVTMRPIWPPLHKICYWKTVASCILNFPKNQTDIIENKLSCQLYRLKSMLFKTCLRGYWHFYVILYST